MEKRAFFFNKDNLLLPNDIPDSMILEGLPLELVNDFREFNCFDITALDDSTMEVPIIHGVSIPSHDALPDGWKGIPVRQILALFSISGTQHLDKIVRACHVSQWREDSRFCGSCGAENEDIFCAASMLGAAQRRCPRCGRTEFPRICPAVIICITDDENRILLAHNKRFKEGVYSHISGFNEAGESLEQTITREIREEVNIEVKDVKYVKSQPWPFPNSLMIGYKARYASGEIKPDGDEITDAKWFTRDNLPELPGEGSLSRYMINSWLNGNL